MYKGCVTVTCLPCKNLGGVMSLFICVNDLGGVMSLFICVNANQHCIRKNFQGQGKTKVTGKKPFAANQQQIKLHPWCHL